MTLLQNLDAVNWGEIEHCYGAAHDVPDQLRSLASGDEATRQAALDALFSNIHHQGTVYAATAHAVPFLIELVAAPQVQGRHLILALLCGIAEGHGAMEVHASPDRKDNFWRHKLGDEAIAARIAAERVWCENARAAVVAGAPVYRELLDDADETVRITAPLLLCECPAWFGEMAPLLRARYFRETQTLFKVSLLLALQQMGQHESMASHAAAFDEFFATVRDAADEDFWLRQLAAVALLERGGAAQIEAALHLFRSTAVVDEEARNQLFWENAEPLIALEVALTPWPAVQREWMFEVLQTKPAAARQSAVSRLRYVCQSRRSAPAQIVPRLALHMADEDAHVRRNIKCALTEGEARWLAVEPLKTLLGHTDPAVQNDVRQTLEKIANHQTKYQLETLLTQPHEANSVPELIAVLKAKGDAIPMGDVREVQRAMVALGDRGAAAREAVPQLKKALKHFSFWERVYAARALWLIEGDPAQVLPTLLAEFEWHFVGLIVMDCLAAIGPAAAEAAPLIRPHLETDERPIGDIELDEALCAMAIKTLAAIG